MQVSNHIQTYNILMQNDKKSADIVLNNIQNNVEYNSHTIPLNVSKAYVSPQISDGYKEIRVFKLPYIGDGKIYELKNGHKVIIVPKEDSITSLTTIVKTGFSDEPDDKKGIAHVLEHLLLNHSYKADEKLQNFFESINAIVNGNTTDGFTGYKFDANIRNSEDLAKLIGVHYKNLTNKFTEKDVEQEKKLILNESIEARLFSDESLIAHDTSIQKLFNFEDNNGFVSEHTADKIKNITLDDLNKFYQNYYKPDNMVTVIIGNVDNNTIKIFNNKFGKMKNTSKSENEYISKKKPKLLNNFSRTNLYTQDKSMSTAIMSFPVLEINKDNIKNIQLLTTLLQRMLSKEGIKSFVEYQVLSSDKAIPQIIKIKILNIDNKIEENIAILNDKIMQLKAGKISNDILQEAKNKFLNDTYTSFEDNEELTWYIAEQFSYDNFDIKSSLNELKQLSVNDVSNTAQKYLNTNQASLVVVNPSNKTNTEISFKGNSKHIEEFTLPNNLHVIVDTKPGTTTSTVSGDFLFENPEYCSKGIMEAMTNSIISLNDYNDFDDTWINPKGFFTRKSGSAEQLLDIVKNVQQAIMNPNFDEKLFEEAKSKQQNLDFQQKKDLTSFDLTLERSYSPQNKNEICPKDITVSDLNLYYENLRNTAQGFIVITTPKEVFEKNKGEILKSIAEIPKIQKLNFDKINNISPKQLERDYEFYEPYDDTVGFEMEKEYKIITNGDIKKEATSMIIRSFLNKKIVDKFRKQEGICYYPHIGITKPSPKHLLLDINVSTYQEPLKENAKYMFLELGKIIDEIRKEPLKTEELESLKKVTISKLFEPKKTSYDRNMEIASNYSTTYDLYYKEKLENEIQQLSVDELYVISKDILSQPSIVTISSNPDIIKFFKKGTIV